MLERSGGAEKIGHDNIFLTVHAGAKGFEGAANQRMAANNAFAISSTSS